MRITVIGAGAIGGFIGARLAAAGATVGAVVRGATYTALDAHGWRVREADGTLLTAPLAALADSADPAAVKALGEQDLVLLGVKAQALPAVLPAVTPLLGPATIVLPALNGVPWWFFDGFGGPCEGRSLDAVDPGGRIAEAIPVRHVVGSVVHMSCATPEPGLVRHVAGTGLILGEPDRTGTPRLAALVELMRGAGLEATASTAIHADIWYKLWGNMTTNPVSALTHATADRILDDELVLAFCHAAMREAAEIGARIGCPIAETPADRTVVTRKLGAFRTSMLQDMEAGRELELNALVGAVREIGRLVEVPTPTVDAILGLTRLAAACR
ncbi:2-dehydropantoate 2-reductase [Streptacidiphilus jiangxiensis]|uniref:2-dehydropantoate 2-reductase n=1 Tax=Streptacidiphilus jiangxiensis TaxID=235985 RepID=A0A1H7XKA9_STRJI|nr:2-dehydropantoate 2-reductase [Streptacidiphilus jiangxiensis]SEM34105.1 2-dehydropantoate 2-reductase [Streptacidiphilus jiangxiensis]